MTPIIIFGAALRPDGSATETLRRRIAAAVAHGWRIGDALYVPTGGVPQSGVTEAQVMTALLLDAGIARDAILPEDRARDTCDSVLICSDMLRELGHRGPVSIVTSDFHMMRCAAMALFAGWRITRVPATALHPRGRAWRMWVWAREFPATAWDVALVVLWRAGVMKTP